MIRLSLAMFSSYDELDKKLHTVKRNRGWIEITNLILIECQRGSVKTRIMYRCNLNSKQIQQYLDFLVKYALIEKRDQATTRKVSQYFATELGLKFIQACSQIREIFRETPYSALDKSGIRS